MRGNMPRPFLSMTITSPIHLQELQLGLPLNNYQVKLILGRRRLLTALEESVLLASQTPELQDLTLDQLAQRSRLNKAMLFTAYEQLCEGKIFPVNNTHKYLANQLQLKDLQLTAPQGEITFQKRYIELQEKPELMQLQYNPLTQRYTFEPQAKQQSSANAILLRFLDFYFDEDELQLNLRNCIRDLFQQKIDTQDQQTITPKNSTESLEVNFISSLTLNPQETSHNLYRIDLSLDPQRGIVLEPSRKNTTNSTLLRNFLQDPTKTALLYRKVIQQVFPSEQQGTDFQQIACEYTAFSSTDEQQHLRHLVNLLVNHQGEIGLDFFDNWGNLEQTTTDGTSQPQNTKPSSQTDNFRVYFDKQGNAYGSLLNLEDVENWENNTTQEWFQDQRNRKCYTKHNLLVTTHFNQEPVHLELTLFRDVSSQFTTYLQQIYAFIADNSAKVFQGIDHNTYPKYFKLFAWCLKQGATIAQLIKPQELINISQLERFKCNLEQYFKEPQLGKHLRSQIKPLASFTQLEEYEKLIGKTTHAWDMIETQFAVQILRIIATNPHGLTDAQDPSQSVKVHLKNLPHACEKLSKFLKEYKHNQLFKHLVQADSREQAFKKNLTREVGSQFVTQLQTICSDFTYLIPTLLEQTQPRELYVLSNLIGNQQFVSSQLQGLPSQDQLRNYQRLIESLQQPAHQKILVHLQAQASPVQALNDSVLCTEIFSAWCTTLQEIFTADSEQHLLQLQSHPEINFLYQLVTDPQQLEEARASLVTRAQQEQFKQLVKLVDSTDTQMLLRHLFETSDPVQAVKQYQLSLERLDKLIAQIHSCCGTTAEGFSSYFSAARPELAQLQQLAYDTTFQSKARTLVVPSEVQKLYAQATEIARQASVQVLAEFVRQDYNCGDFSYKSLPTVEKLEILITQFTKLWDEHTQALPAIFEQANPQLAFLHQLAFDSTCQAQLRPYLLSDAQQRALDKTLRLVQSETCQVLAQHLQNLGTSEQAYSNSHLTVEKFNNVLQQLKELWNELSELPSLYLNAEPQLMFWYHLRTDAQAQTTALQQLVTEAEQEAFHLAVTKHAQSANHQDKLIQDALAQMRQEQQQSWAQLQEQMNQVQQQVAQQQLAEVQPSPAQLTTKYQYPTKFNPQQTLYIAVDTNMWLIDKEESKNLKDLTSQSNVCLLIAQQVLDELDKHKGNKKPDNAEKQKLAASAISIIRKLKQKAKIHSNQNPELEEIFELKLKNVNPDKKIIAAALDYREQNQGNVVMLSRDNNVANYTSLYQLPTLENVQVLRNFLKQQGFKITD